MNKLFCIKKFSRFVLLMVVIFSSSIMANSATFIVTKTADTNDGVCDADCSLREAIAEANNSATNDVIEFSSLFNSAQIITLLNGELVVDNNGTLTINGAGASLLTVSGNNASRVFYFKNSATATIADLKVTGGNGIGAPFVGRGGGIYAADNTVITINNLIVSNNSAANSGGGIANRNGNMTINNSTIVNNFSGLSGGGGILNFGGSLMVNSSLISNNESSGNGSGIFNSSQSTLNLTNSTVDKNSTSGSRGFGGGIVNYGTANINNTTINNNSASQHGGGILVTDSSTTIMNSTVTGNFAARSGGGISSLQSNADTIVTLINATINSNTANNHSGGIENTGTFNSRNSIIADNFAPNFAPDFSGILTSQGYNLIENTSGITILGTTTGNILEQDPQLLPLGNYGGATQTVALQPTSPAVDSADPNNFPETDQRGVPRPQDGDLNGSFLPDIGAYEVQPPVVPPDELIGVLIETIGNYIDNPNPRLRAGIERILIAKLENALADLAAGDRQGAKDEIEAFINLVRSLAGELISQKRAEELIAEANKILAAINFQQ